MDRVRGVKVYRFTNELLVDNNRTLAMLGDVLNPASAAKRQNPERSRRGP